MRLTNYIQFNQAYRLMRWPLTFILLISALEIYSQSERTVPVMIHSIEFNSNSHIGGMADIGVVASPFYPEAGLSQNPALLSTNAEYAGINISYMPMSRNISSDINLSSANVFFALNSKNVIGYSYSRFSLGDILLMDELGLPLEIIQPTESYYKISYSRAISDFFALGLALKLIDSKQGGEIQPINTFAVDLGVSHKKRYVLTEQISLNTNAGGSINNFGPKLSYEDLINHYFMPTNLKLGVLMNPEYSVTNKFNVNWEVAFQMEKDLIPSEPEYLSDHSRLIVSGYNPDISPFQALYQSFYDSPRGISGELKEIRYKFGTELRANYDNKVYLALRYGRYNETSMTDHNYLTTTGIGIGLFGFSLDYKHTKPDLLSNSHGSFAFTLGYRINLNDKAFRF